MFQITNQYIYIYIDIKGYIYIYIYIMDIWDIYIYIPINLDIQTRHMSDISGYSSMVFEICSGIGERRLIQHMFAKYGHV